MDYVLGCDFGSQSVKVILLNQIGEIICESNSSYEIEYPYPAWAQQDPDCWIKGGISAIRSILQETGVSADQIKAIGIDAQVDGVIAIDKTGKVLYPAIIWMDRRASRQVEKLADTEKNKWIFSRSGLNLDASHVAPKIQWLIENIPGVYEKTRYFLLPGSHIAYLLSGEIAVDFSNASSTLLMDIATRQWSKDLCDHFNIPVEKLPPIFPSTQVLGTIRSLVADQIGLHRSTKIILGCGDEHAACLGAGAISQGIVCDIAGTAEPVCISSQAPIFDSEGLVETHSHAHPDLWLIENPGFVSGGNLRWFRDEFVNEFRAPRVRNENSYEDMFTEAARVSPGSEGVILLPTLMGASTPTWNADVRGMFMGFSLNHKRSHFIRAILESSAYALRDITDRMQEIGMNIKELRIVGGGARSGLWKQIKADVTGLPIVQLQTSETSALGASLIAKVGAGMDKCLEDAVSASVHVIETREPDQILHQRYEQYYQIYREAYFAMMPVFKKASRISL